VYLKFESTTCTCTAERIPSDLYILKAYLVYVTYFYYQHHNNIFNKRNNVVETRQKFNIFGCKLVLK